MLWAIGCHKSIGEESERKLKYLLCPKDLLTLEINVSDFPRSQRDGRLEYRRTRNLVH